MTPCLPVDTRVTRAMTGSITGLRHDRRLSRVAFAMSLVQGASGPGSNPWVLAGGLAALMILALVRLLSEVPFGATKKEKAMGECSRRVREDRPIDRTRKYWQFLLETMWAAGAGVIGSPLAALSQRTARASRRALALSCRNQTRPVALSRHRLIDPGSRTKMMPPQVHAWHPSTSCFRPGRT